MLRQAKVGMALYLKIKYAPMLDISVHFAISKEMKIVTGKEVAK